MPRQVFVNLAVSDLDRSRAFFGSLGFTFNPQFSNEQAACMVLTGDSFVMLLTKDFFKSFTDRAIADSTQSTEALICLSCTSRAEVQALVGKAVEAGGKAHRQPQDHGFMYGHGFEDPDGHIWELAFMEPAAAPKAA